MEKREIKFLSNRSYKIGGRPNQRIITLGEYIKADAGEEFFQANLADGCILLIPVGIIEKYQI
jgi:hypothetical protein